MPNGIELAKAYVQIVPSAEGIKSALTEMFDEETDGLGERTGQSIGQKLVATLKNTIAAAGIGKIISDSLNMGGALQQSLGGVETLFKDSADTVKAYAAEAYRTVGLSANDYMEQTTSFAASLQDGDRLRLYRENGELRLEQVVNGTGYNIMSALDASCTLWTLRHGVQAWQRTADSGTEWLFLTLTCSAAFSTVVIETEAENG